MAGESLVGSGSLIAGRYRLTPGGGRSTLGGFQASPVTDVMEPAAALVALVPEDVSPHFERYRRLEHPALLPIRAHGEIDGIFHVIVPTPQGHPLVQSPRKWREREIIDGIIKPLASLIAAAQRARLTLRCLRPETIYAGMGLQFPCVLPPGLSMPAAGQSVAFEPLASAVCAPAARGVGTVADDVFALGVIALVLCTGEPPLAGFPDAEILARRFGVGTPDAYLRNQSVPRGLVSALRAMLSDDPAQRPHSDDLVNMEGSKLFSVRSQRSPQGALHFNGRNIATRRELAWRATENPAEFLRLLGAGAVAAWCDSAHVDLMTGVRPAEAARSFTLPGGLQTDEDIIAHAINRLDPDAPLYLGRRWFWPDALPGMLVTEAATANNADGTQGMVALSGQVLSPTAPYQQWTGRIGSGCRSLMEAVRRTGRKGSSRIWRMVYDGNPWQYCLSPETLPRKIMLPAPLLAACDVNFANRAPLDDAAVEKVRQRGVLDIQAQTFLESTCLRHGLPFAGSASATGAPVWLADARLLMQIQDMSSQVPLIGIATALSPLFHTQLVAWRNLTVRAQKKEKLDKAIAAGRLTEILAVIDDPLGLANDEAGLAAAKAQVSVIEGVRAGMRKPIKASESGEGRNADLTTLLAGIGLAIASCGVEFLQ